MQQQFKVKTEYKSRQAKPTSALLSFPSKWKMSFALSLLAFAIIWHVPTWINHSNNNTEAWVDENQVTLALTLPNNEIETTLIHPKTQEKFTSQGYEWKNYTIQAGDNLGYYFQQAGLSASSIQKVLSISKHASYLKKIYPGQVLKIKTNDEGELIALNLDIDPLTTLIIDRQNNHLRSRIEDKPLEKRVAFGGGKIFDSFFVAGKHAKLDDALILELANIFAYDIDFALDIKPNDYFKVLFEEYFVNGVKVGNGPIVAAEFVNNGKQYRAIRYTDSSGQSNYYSPSGTSLKKAFIRTPVQYTRISSHFNLHRRHPVLHKIRAHKGVDYAAPTGTPVKAAGQGKVVFVGRKGGYGNAIILQHGSKYTTLYGHLSRFAKNLRTGATIKQGQIIGYVGSTGLASGPHLHFEFRVNGVHQNPLTVALPMADGITGKAKTQFLNYAGNLLRLMEENHSKVMLASND